MPESRSVVSGVGGLAWVGLRSFIGTVLALTVFGVALAVGSFYALSDHRVYAFLAALVAVAESVAAGVVLGAKRGLALALAQGVRQLRLGSATVKLLFERLLGVCAEQQLGERGGRVARAAERLPLDRAEHYLAWAVRGTLRAEAGGITGRVRRRLQERLLGTVHRYTLARFREEGARHGGVDLLKVQADLEGRIDDLLLAKLRGGLMLWTVLVILGLPAAVAAHTYLMMALLH
jgi:hypothetical protein